MHERSAAQWRRGEGIKEGRIHRWRETHSRTQNHETSRSITLSFNDTNSFTLCADRCMSDRPPNGEGAKELKKDVFTDGERHTHALRITRRVDLSHYHSMIRTPLLSALTDA